MAFARSGDDRDDKPTAWPYLVMHRLTGKVNSARRYLLISSHRNFADEVRAISDIVCKVSTHILVLSRGGKSSSMSLVVIDLVPTGSTMPNPGRMTELL